MNLSLQFWELQFPKSYATSDMAYVPINCLLRFWIQNLMRLLMFDELVITILETAVPKILCNF